MWHLSPVYQGKFDVEVEEKTKDKKGLDACRSRIPSHFVYEREPTFFLHIRRFFGSAKERDKVVNRLCGLKLSTNVWVLMKITNWC